MMLYVLGVSAACYLVLTATGVLREMPDAERAASIYVSVAALAGVVAWAAPARGAWRRQRPTSSRSGYSCAPSEPSLIDRMAGRLCPIEHDLSVVANGEYGM
jgi:hypothetical protein